MNKCEFYTSTIFCGCKVERGINIILKGRIKVILIWHVELIPILIDFVLHSKLKFIDINWHRLIISI